MGDRLGRPLRDLRVSVTDRCNFRCPYCMPKTVFGRDHAFLPRAEILSFEEITRVVGAAAALGVTKVRLTGGEPLVRRDLERLVAMLAAVEGISDLAVAGRKFSGIAAPDPQKPTGCRTRKTWILPGASCWISRVFPTWLFCP